MRILTTGEVLYIYTKRGCKPQTHNTQQEDELSLPYPPAALLTIFNMPTCCHLMIADSIWRWINVNLTHFWRVVEQASIETMQGTYWKMENGSTVAIIFQHAFLDRREEAMMESLLWELFHYTFNAPGRMQGWHWRGKWGCQNWMASFNNGAHQYKLSSSFKSAVDPLPFMSSN